MNQKTPISNLNKTAIFDSEFQIRLMNAQNNIIFNVHQTIA